MKVSPFPTKPGTDDLQCVLKDDGCTTLFQLDLDTFDMRSGQQFRLDVIRDNTRVATVGDAALEVSAVSQVQMVLIR